MRLEGKVALITGGGSGMGKVAAELFAQQGATVVLTDVNDGAGEDTAAAIGDQAVYVHADVSKEADAERMVSTALDRFGKLDILYNNAGVMLPDDGSVHTTDERIWDITLAINVKGVAFGCKYGVPAMLASGGGSIINVASFVAWLGAATSQTAYTASKGAVLAMTREIAVEYARKGIRCNALCPGPIETPLLMQLLSDEQKRQRRFVHIPMGRLGQAEELAKAALFLASDDSSFMTGASLDRGRRDHRRVRDARGLKGPRPSGGVPHRSRAQAPLGAGHDPEGFPERLAPQRREFVRVDEIVGSPTRSDAGDLVDPGGSARRGGTPHRDLRTSRRRSVRCHARAAIGRAFGVLSPLRRPYATLPGRSPA